MGDRSRLTSVVLAVSAVLICGCSEQKPESQTASGLRAANVMPARLSAAGSDPDNWMSHGRTYAEERFSPLTKINDSNVQKLGLAWYFEADSNIGTEVTPLVVDGVLYTTGTWNVLHAIDAATGKEIWRYDPQPPRHWIRYTCCGPANRGAALWDGRVYFGTIDGRLIAVDAGTGKLAWQVQTTDPDSRTPSLARRAW